MTVTAEQQRLLDYRTRVSNWKLWGPYLSERSWGTVREDYSADGNAWDYFPHDHARSRAYRWGEDGIGGFSDRDQYLCLAAAFWNGKDPILKERFFGVGANEGNHGEDVKECYYYLDATPTHSYMKMLYKYPQREYPYEALVRENRSRSRKEPEYEIFDTGIFDDQCYFDCFISYAKVDQDDLFYSLEVHNRAAESHPIHILPTLWLRNTWSWGYPRGPMKDVAETPSIELVRSTEHFHEIQVEHSALGTYYWYVERSAEVLFTENETNAARIFGGQNPHPHTKDAFHYYVVNGDASSLSGDARGTKCAAHIRQEVPGGGSVSVLTRLSKQRQENPFANATQVFVERKAEADQFYAAIQDAQLGPHAQRIQRQAYAGLIWSKQFYYYDMEQWLKGDPSMPPPPATRSRNSNWMHLTNFDIISMPDTWEFPWYAAWDLAFHCIPLALLDADFAKRQLELMTREWYMHPNGQLPAYEWSFSDVNPPVHAWAAWRVYKIESKHQQSVDREFLEGIFHKLLLNFTWWINRKDVAGRNIFEGGFLGLDNIGVFDRSAPLPEGVRIDQSDATGWVASYSLLMVKIAIELARENKVYQDSASKFLEHFLRVAHASTNIGHSGIGLWDEQDGFFYDVLHFDNGDALPLKVRSLVGLIPLIATETIEPIVLESMPDFARRLQWFVRNRPHLSTAIARIDVPGVGQRRLVSLVSEERLKRICRYMFDEQEFLSPYGLRSLSKFHQHHPYTLHLNGQEFTIGYEPAESETELFGGNSNWRGPIWFPTNFLLIEALQRFHHYYGDSFTVEYPTHSGEFYTLEEIAADLSRRLSSIFLPNEDGIAPFLGKHNLGEKDPHFRELIQFNEYFHGETGAGLGASHQTGWTALVAKLVQQSGCDEIGRTR